jgi:hypothetical protein
VSGADINDPQVIRDFRAQLAKFAQVCANALGARAGELGRMHEWLRGEQLPHWKHQAFKREEAYQNARRLWLQAESDVAGSPGSRGPKKPSSYEEKLEMDKARRLRDEAEEKLANVKRWVARLDHEAGPLIQSCHSRALELEEKCRGALLQLDRMAERVQDYLDLPSASLAPPAPAPREGGA